MDCRDLSKKVENWIAQKVEETKTNGVVIGVSGGIDAAVCVGLSVRALGCDKVSGVIVRTIENIEEFENGKLICKTFNIEPIIIDLQETYSAALESLPPSTPLAEEGLRDRLRSAVLYYIANMKNQLVVSTLNKNEYMLGYFCKNGSGMADIMPIADIYKSDIWKIGTYIGVPNEIINKAPTGDSANGPVTEDIIGVPFSDQEIILKSIESNETVCNKNENYDRLYRMYKNSFHKRQVIPRCIISN